MMHNEQLNIDTRQVAYSHWTLVPSAVKCICWKKNQWFLWFCLLRFYGPLKNLFKILLKNLEWSTRKGCWVSKPKTPDIVYVQITPLSTRKALYLWVLPIALTHKSLFEQREPSSTFQKISWNYINALAIYDWYSTSFTTLKNENL